MTQIFPLSRANSNRLTTIILWFIWQGTIFRVPTSTLQKTKQQGGWALVDIAAKCKTLLLNRMWVQSNKEGTATAAWLKEWNLSGPQENPPPRDRKLQQFEYLQLYARDMAYIPHPDRDESTKAFKKRIYKTLHTGSGGHRQQGNENSQTMAKQRLGSYMEEPAHCCDNGYTQIDMVQHNS